MLVSEEIALMICACCFVLWLLEFGVVYLIVEELTISYLFPMCILIRVVIIRVRNCAS